MAVVQSSYSERISAAVNGMIADMRNWDAETMICETSAGIGFGLAVGKGTADRGCVLGASAATGFRGISIRDITLVTQEGQTVDKYQRYDNVAVLTEGDIWVRVDGAVSANQNVVFNSTTGKLGTAAADGTHFLIVGARWVTTQSQDDGLAIVRLGVGNAAA